MCGWVFLDCPPAPCPAVGCDLECPPGYAPPSGRDGCEDTCECDPLTCSDAECGPPSLAPSFECADGSRGGNIGVCERAAEGTCGWVIRACPAEECPREACGAPIRPPLIECADGSLGGNTGRCLRGEGGSCRWELREYPDACAEVPQCRLACPPGTRNPTDVHGCLLTCECEPDR